MHYNTICDSVSVVQVGWCSAPAGGHTPREQRSLIILFMAIWEGVLECGWSGRNTAATMLWKLNKNKFSLMDRFVLLEPLRLLNVTCLPVHHEREQCSRCMCPFRSRRVKPSTPTPTPHHPYLAWTMWTQAQLAAFIHLTLLSHCPHEQHFLFQEILSQANNLIVQYRNL